MPRRKSWRDVFESSRVDWLTCVVCGAQGYRESFENHAGEVCCREDDNTHLCANQLRQWRMIEAQKGEVTSWRRHFANVYNTLTSVPTGVQNG